MYKSKTGLKISDGRHTTPALMSYWKLYDLQAFALTNRFLRDFSLRFDMRGGSLKISLSR